VTVVVTAKQMIRGSILGEKAMKSKEPINYIGKKFGRLTVIERVEDAIIPSTKKHVVRYRCLCDCGNEKIIRKLHLTNGSIISCGCYQREQLGNRRRKHGFSHKEKLYTVWLDMKERCRNPKNIRYNSYGGRGIKVCPEWSDNYLSFREWSLSNGYMEDLRESGRNNLTIDRIDVNGNYEPNNCRWITNKENCLNKRNTMTDEERYKACPVCGKTFELKRRNEKQTCSAMCGQTIRKINYPQKRNANGTFKSKLPKDICDEKIS
jgi:predicted nucleic acid-binding Zn ribbon protein